MAGGKSSIKCLGYKVDKKIFPGGRLFTGVVMLTSGTKSGDLFNKLKDIFESQHDITRIDKLEEIPAFKGTIETKYKDEARCREKSGDKLEEFLEILESEAEKSNDELGQKEYFGGQSGGFQDFKYPVDGL